MRTVAAKAVFLLREEGCKQQGGADKSAAQEALQCRLVFKDASLPMQPMEARRSCAAPAQAP